MSKLTQIEVVKSYKSPNFNESSKQLSLAKNQNYVLVKYFAAIMAAKYLKSSRQLDVKLLQIFRVQFKNLRTQFKFVAAKLSKRKLKLVKIALNWLVLLCSFIFALKIYISVKKRS